ncbi:zcchc10 protein [Anaeramoeba flamelloides]|uniref:Zcchc10 protein n=1 Tax=Anaeramoeba flamelloides TaxID=1746091 RepID=A0AAV8A7W1_9EUKA|nr:zcchc10 protein [Anaeramoeba flamelloides]
MEIYLAQCFYDNLKCDQPRLIQDFFKNYNKAEEFCVSHFREFAEPEYWYFLDDTSDELSKEEFDELLHDRCYLNTYKRYPYRSFEFKITLITDKKGNILKSPFIIYLNLDFLNKKVFFKYLNKTSKSRILSDLENFYKKQEFTDLEIRGKKVHKLILEKRTKMKATEIVRALEKKKENEKINEQDLEHFLHWVYFIGLKYDQKKNGNIITQLKKEYLNSLKKVFNRLNLDIEFEKEIENKTNSYYYPKEKEKDCFKFFQGLMNDEGSKDFGIKIQAHKKNSTRKKNISNESSSISSSSSDFSSSPFSSSSETEIDNENENENDEINKQNLELSGEESEQRREIIKIKKQFQIEKKKQNMEEKKEEEEEEEKVNIKRVHFLMLLIRSGLFRNLKRSVGNLEETITDFSGFSNGFWDVFLCWMYTGKIKKEELTKKIRKELKNAEEYFQLNHQPHPIFKFLPFLP